MAGSKYEGRLIGGPNDGVVLTLEKRHSKLHFPLMDRPIAFRPDPVSKISMVEYDEYIYVLKDVSGEICRYVPSEYNI